MTLAGKVALNPNTTNQPSHFKTSKLCKGRNTKQTAMPRTAPEVVVEGHMCNACRRKQQLNSPTLRKLQEVTI